MNAADVIWLNAPRSLEVRREALRAPEAGELLCETIVSAISPGTELAAYTGLPPLRPGNIYPRLQGYCNVARAVESRADGMAAGDLVLTFQSHRSAFVIPAAEVLVRLPADVDPGVAATTYLFHLGYNAVLRSGARAGSRVTVIGLGALGLTSVAAAALAGAEVTAISNHPAPAAKARALGAAEIVTRSDAPTLPKADVVVATTNSWDDWALALAIAAQAGTIAVLGFPGRGEPVPTANPLDSAHFYMKQLRIEAVGMSPEVNDSRGFLRFNERDNLAFLLRRIADGRLDAGALISGRYPGREIERAYEDLLARRDEPVTYLLEWNA